MSQNNNETTLRSQEGVPLSKGSRVPAAAAMLAAMQGGDIARVIASRALTRSMADLPEISDAAGTLLKDIAAFTRREADDIAAFAASKNVTVPIMAAGKAARGHAYSLDPSRAVKAIYSKSPVFRDVLNMRLEIEGVAGGFRPHIGTGVASVPALMHEIGHASPILGSTSLRNALQGVAGVSSSAIGRVARGALMINSISNPTEGESGARAFAREHAPAIIAATTAPLLVEEARASINALRGARRFGPGVAATARQLIPAFGTYVASAAAPVLATMLGQKVLRSIRKNKQEQEAGTGGEKTAAMIGKEVQAPGILRASASTAWQTGLSAPKPKSTRPTTGQGARAKDMPAASPPSKTSFYSDVVKSLNNPQRGFRGAKPTG